MNQATYSDQKYRLIKKLMRRDGHSCWICKTPVRFGKGFYSFHPMAATLDHVIPKSVGGTNVQSNLKIAHYSCNSGRGDTEAVKEEECPRCLGVKDADPYVPCHDCGFLGIMLLGVQ